MTSDLKQVVKQKYGEAAIRVWSAAQKSCCQTPGCQAKGEPVTPSFYDDADQRHSRRGPCWLHWDAAIPRLLPN